MPYDIGDSVPLGITVRDSEGVATNATSVTLTITLPDDSIVTPGVLNPPNVTGQYEVDYVPTMAGRHSLSWITSNPTTAYTDIFDVRPTVPRYIVSLSDMKKFLNITSTTEDELIRGFLESATEVIEGQTKQIVVPQTFTESCFPSWQIVLYKTPVISISSVQQVGFGVNQTLTAGDFSIDTTSGIVQRTDRGWIGGEVTVTYKAGYSIVPSNYAQAAKLIVQHLYESQRGMGYGSTRFGADVQIPGFAHAIPLRALELIGPPAPMVG